MEKEILKEFVQKFATDYNKDGRLDVVELKVSNRSIILIITPPEETKKIISIDLKTGRILSRGFNNIGKINANGVATLELIAALINFPKERRAKFLAQLEELMFENHN